MSDVISYAKEVYYKFRDEETGTAHVVPIRGMYVTGEYKPPLYAEPIVRMVSLTTRHPVIEEYIERNINTYNSGSHHLFDVSLDATFRIDEYSSATAPNQYASGSHHMFDVDLDPSIHIDYYSTSSKSITAEGSHHLFDASIDPTYVLTDQITQIKSSQPEPIIRFVLMTSNHPTITNET